jgi:hypothetical protein
MTEQELHEIENLSKVVLAIDSKFPLDDIPDRHSGIRRLIERDIPRLIDEIHYLNALEEDRFGQEPQSACPSCDEGEAVGS